MSQRLIARLSKPGETIRVIRDSGGLNLRGFYFIHDGPQTQTIDHITISPALVISLYELQGFKQLVLCAQCKGEGWIWANTSDSCGDPVKDVCDACQGEGGK